MRRDCLSQTDAEANLDTDWPSDWPSEPLPLTPKELADYLGVPLTRVEEWIRTQAVKTVDVNGSVRIPFFEYERRAKGRRGIEMMSKRRKMRLYLTVLVYQGDIVERGYRNGHPVFVASEYAD